MADTNDPTTTAAADPTATSSAPAPAADDTKRDELPRKLFATRAEAEAAKPANPPKNTKAFEITKSGTVLGWVLAIGYDPAISRAAQLDGYSASAGKGAKEVTKEAAAAKLAALSDAELAAMGLSRVPTAPAPTAPTTPTATPTAPTKGKGKTK
jgi:hypothetical protein